MKSINLPTIYIDAGHGGIDSKGNYTTPPSNGKLYKHPNFTFYEGYWNRIYADEFIKQSAGIFNVVKVYNDITDTSLSSRVQIANLHYNLIKPAQSLYLSLHSNAANTKARGWSVFTSVGVTKSDYYANNLITDLQSLKTQYSDFTIRKSSNHNLGGDYETSLYVLKNTVMPAILIENLFFDNAIDANLIINEQFIKDYTAYVIKSLQRTFSELL